MLGTPLTHTAHGGGVEPVQRILPLDAPFEEGGEEVRVAQHLRREHHHLPVRAAAGDLLPSDPLLMPLMLGVLPDASHLLQVFP